MSANASRASSTDWENCFDCATRASPSSARRASWEKPLLRILRSAATPVRGCAVRRRAIVRQDASGAFAARMIEPRKRAHCRLRHRVFADAATSARFAKPAAAGVVVVTIVAASLDPAVLPVVPEVNAPRSTAASHRQPNCATIRDDVRACRAGLRSRMDERRDVSERSVPVAMP